MLKALYDYAMEHGLAETPGYAKERIRAYICLTDAEQPYTGLHVCGRDDTALCPDVGSRKNGPSVSRVLYERPSVLFAAFPEKEQETPKETKEREKKLPKREFLLKMFRAAAEADPALELCIRAMESSEIAQAVREDLKRKKIKDTESLSFMIDRRSILDRESVRQWWNNNRRAILADIDGAKAGKAERAEQGQEALCLITGEQTVPVRTLPPLKGLTAVGGQGSVPLFGFDKSAFRSYELEQSANAPVSENAVSAVTFALNDLIDRAPDPVGGMLFLHWYSHDVRDIITEEVVNGEDSESDSGEEKHPVRKTKRRDNPKAAKKKADQLVQSVWTGKGTSLKPNTLYYILLVSGNGGRVMIRRFEEGNYETLEENLKRWKEDLKLCNPAGTAPLKPFKLSARLYRLLSYRESRDKPWEKSGRISRLTTDVIHAILNAQPLPEAVAARALAYLRSQILDNTLPDESRNTRVIPDGIAVQWLKVWIVRNEKVNREVQLMEEYNMNSGSIAYHCGGAMAVLVEIQRSAMPDVNASIVERFFSSAMQTPALVIGRLARMSNHHLEMIENTWLADRFREHLREVFTAMRTDTLPATLKLEEQSSFAVGYYQMGAKLSRERLERVAASKARKEAGKQNPGAETPQGAEVQMNIDQLTMNG